MNFLSHILSSAEENKLFNKNNFFKLFIKCDIAYGTKSFFDYANETQSTLLMFGGSCDILQQIAESVKFFNLTIVIDKNISFRFLRFSFYYSIILPI